MRANKSKTAQNNPYDWSSLRRNQNINESFKITLKNKFSALQEENVLNSANQTFMNFESACKEAATESVPLKPKVKQRVPWETEEISKKRKKLKSTAKIKNSNPSNSNLANFKKAQSELSKTYMEEQIAYLQNKIDIISKAAVNKQSAEAWKTVNEISGRKTTNKSKLKAANQEERINLWKEHFQNLLGKPPKVIDRPIKQIFENELNIKKGNFDMEELEVVLKKLSNGKACGLDDIPAEVWKTRNFNKELLAMCNAVYNQQRIDR